MSNDTCCTLVPYFKVHDGQLEVFKAGCPAFVEATQKEDGVLHYGFSFDGDTAHCREGYKDAASVLAHLENVGGLLQEALKIAELIRLEVHAPADQIEILRTPLAPLEPQYFTMEIGFRR